MMMNHVLWLRAGLVALCCMAALSPLESFAQFPPAGGQAEGKPKRPSRKFREPKGAKRLVPDYDVWVDPVKKEVILDGTVCMREGLLEMLACLKGTKEHESVISVKTKAFVVHAALLQVGAEAGGPAQFEPEYAPAKGTEIEIDVYWYDKHGLKHQARAQDWIRHIKSQKPLAYNWVFAGSGFWTDKRGKKHYQAEDGDLICVSNFPTATLDVPVESPQANKTLVFDAFTDKIPPLGTPVRLVLKPKFDDDKDAEKDEKPAKDEAAEKDPLKPKTLEMKTLDLDN